uniref:Uncharacterized protein n=1 Tax=Arcella intermedia TaxID=1963864 RepID=A0A6B2LPD6_9EUKA
MLVCFFQIFNLNSPPLAFLQYLLINPLTKNRRSPHHPTLIHIRTPQHHPLITLIQLPNPHINRRHNQSPQHRERLLHLRLLRVGKGNLCLDLTLRVILPVLIIDEEPTGAVLGVCDHCVGHGAGHPGLEGCYFVPRAA